MTSETQRLYRERILKVLVHIQQHLDHALSLDALAELAHFSPYHFHRIFRGMVGEGVGEHVRRLRLERAAHRLKFTNQEITRIAFDAGYETHESFTKAFRRLFDESPSGFRKIHRTLPIKEVANGVHYDPDKPVTEFNSPEVPESVSLTLTTHDPIQVVFARHTGPYTEVGETWQRLMGWAGPKGLLGPMMTLLGIVHDDPEVTPEDKIRYDAGLVIRAEVEPTGEIGVQTLPGGEYASTTHRGPYETLGQSYALLCGPWLSEQGREPASQPCLEFYKNSPMNTAPENLLTEIRVPLVNP